MSIRLSLLTTGTACAIALAGCTGNVNLKLAERCDYSEVDEEACLERNAGDQQEYDYALDLLLDRR